MLGEFHLSEAIRIQRMAGEDQEHQDAQRLLRWLVKKKPVEFRVRDVVANGPRPRRSTDEVKEIVNVLCEHGYVRSRPLGKNEKEPTFEVRPDVANVANVAGISV